MTPAQFLEHADHADAGRGLQNRHDLGLPVRLERVRPAPASRLRLDRGRTRVGLDPIRAGSRKPRLRRGGLRGKRSSVIHVKPHLVVGDVDARQAVDSPSYRDESTACAGRSRLPAGLKKRAADGTALRSGYALPSVRPHRRSHPDRQNEPTSLRAGNVVLSCSAGNHAGWRGLPGGAEGIRTSDLRSAGTRALHTAPPLPVVEGLLSKARRWIPP